MDQCHLIPKQVVKRELYLKRTDAELANAIIWHPAVWVWGCRRHHGDFDNHAFTLGRRDLPEAIELYARAFELEWWLDRSYGQRGPARAPDPPGPGGGDHPNQGGSDEGAPG